MSEIEKNVQQGEEQVCLIYDEMDVCDDVLKDVNSMMLEIDCKVFNLCGWLQLMGKGVMGVVVLGVVFFGFVVYLMVLQVDKKVVGVQIDVIFRFDDVLVEKLVC